MIPDTKTAPDSNTVLMEGVLLRRLEMHRDDRGYVSELLRESWQLAPRPAQWNLVSTQAGVVRGVHVHLLRHDLLCVLHGSASIGLADLRRKSTTYKKRLAVELKADDLNVITIPPGVVHGFYSNSDSLLACAFSEEWDPTDDFGCHWADINLGIPWPSGSARCSQKDDQLPSFDLMLAALPDWLG